jgi:hypothetical protein
MVGLPTLSWFRTASGFWPLTESEADALVAPSCSRKWWRALGVTVFLCSTCVAGITTRRVRWWPVVACEHCGRPVLNDKLQDEITLSHLNRVHKSSRLRPPKIFRV